MFRLFKALSRKMPDHSLSNPILATVLDGSLNFFHLNCKDFDKNE
jgi:hypothetical protein